MATDAAPAFPCHFVIVGSSIAEATGLYHELHKNGDERLRGGPIRLAVIHTARRHLEGLRVRDYEITDSAAQHPHFWDVHDLLERSVLMTNYRNNPQTGAQ